ncbi:MAG TPA: hypothetical protein IGS37_00855 [Synechococcales cyanobacterium M55_K2018_004]|nr:hypothetical protein [Synechococcales cyanobacterium M55_K2018_004]
MVLTHPLQDGRCSNVLACVVRRSPLPPLSAPLAQPDTAILLNLSLTANNLSGRLTVSQTWINSTSRFGGDSLRDGKAERTPTSNLHTTARKTRTAWRSPA